MTLDCETQKMIITQTPTLRWKMMKASINNQEFKQHKDEKEKQSRKNV